MKTHLAANADTKEIFVKMVIGAWEIQHAKVTKLLEYFSDEQLFLEVAPGKNRGIYLIGHLAAVSDGMFTLLGWGEKLYPQLEVPFIKNPDRSSPDMPSASEVRECWNKINTKITDHIKTMHSDEWFTKHSSITAEDFVSEPHRNKLNILINRTNHMSYHLGQLVFLVKK